MVRGLINRWPERFFAIDRASIGVVLGNSINNRNYKARKLAAGNQTVAPTAGLSDILLCSIEHSINVLEMVL